MRMNSSRSASGTCSMMCAIRNHFVKDGITASLDNQNSPSSETWCRYVPGVVSTSSNGATRQPLAPQELVIAPERWAESVRISSGRRVRSEVEGDVDHVDGR